METKLNSDEITWIQESIKEKYKEVAVSPQNKFSYPTGRAGLEGQRYDPELLHALSEDVLASYCGVGNPFSLAPVTKGEAVLDIGCGAGVDTIIAGMMAGPTGRAVGIDIVPEMLERAESNLKMTNLKNVSFKKASGENLPFEDTEFDVVISNGVINLIPDKAAVLVEIKRVLKPGGRLMVADQVAIGSVTKDIKARLANWFQ